MKNIIFTVIILLIVSSAVIYICRQKKKGAKCIGCPSSSKCSCGCSSNKKN